MELKECIRRIPNFPKPGVLFYDISTLIRDAEAWQKTINQLTILVQKFKPDLLIGIESRGFLIAAPLALSLGIGFQMIRKEGKLPGVTNKLSYDLEYGTDTIELQEDAIKGGERVVLVDDLLATGGTALAAIDLINMFENKNIVGAGFIINLPDLNGYKLLKKRGIKIHSLMEF